MHRIDAPDATPDHKFTEGDPTAPIPATTVTDDWLNAVQEELSHTIESTGVALDKRNNTQLATAIVLLSAGGRSQREWTLATPLISGGTLNLPPEVGYTVGAGALLLAWDGLWLSAKNYTEVGRQGEKSTAVTLLFDAPAGSEFCAALTAAGGGR